MALNPSLPASIALVGCGFKIRGFDLGLPFNTIAIQGEFEVPDNLSLPCTLHAALERLKRSQLARELFGTEFIEGYIASKTLELTSFFDEITPWERRVLAAQA